MRHPEPRLSVVIPARDRARELGPTLDALEASRDAAFEVIVVDDGSRDDTAAVAEARGCAVVRHAESRGAAAARNSGARAARAPLLLFVDSDVVVDPELLQRVERAFADPGAVALTGLLKRVSLAPGLASQYDALYMHYQYWTHPEEIDIFYTSCAAIRREAFLASGGFDENYRGAGVEDMELGQRLRRAGVPLRLDKTLQVAHAHPFTARELLRKNARTAGATLKLMLRNRLAGHVSGRLVAPPWGFLLGIPLTLLALALIGLSPLLGGAALAAALGCLAAVLALNRGFLGFVASARGPGFLAAALPLMFANYVAYAAGLAGGALGFAAGSRY